MRNWLLSLVLLTFILVASPSMSNIAYAGSEAAKPNIFIVWMPDEAECRPPVFQLNQLLFESLRNLGFNVTLVTSFEEYRRALSTIKEGDILINLHGSVIPLPPDYASLGAKGALDFIKRLATNITNRGFIYLHSAGMPFRYASNKEMNVWIDLGESGLNAFMKALNASASIGGYLKDAGSLDGAFLTGEGYNISEITGIELPEEIHAIYCISTNIPPYVTIYETNIPGYLEPFVAVALYKLGRGFYVHCGFWLEDEQLKSKVVLASIAYILQVADKPSKVFLLSVEGVPWYGVDMPLARDILERELSEMGIEYEVINATSRLLQLMEKGLENVILVNLHGSILPAPPDVLSKGGEEAYSFVCKLAQLVRDKGWSFVNVAGYPLYVASGEGSKGWTLMEEGGLMTFLTSASNFTVGGYCWDGLSERRLGSVLTKFGLELADEYHMDPWKFWAAVLTPYAISTSLQCYLPLYALAAGDGEYWGVAAFKAGSGFYVHVGVDERTPEVIRASMIVALIKALIPKSVIVRVVDRSGAPISGAEVRVFTIDGELVVKGVTDEDGFIKFRLPGGEYIVNASRRGFDPRSTRLYLLVEGKQLNIVLSPLELKVRVLDALTMEPIGAARVLVFDINETLVASGITDDQGIVTFQLPEGAYYVKVQAVNYTEYTGPLIYLNHTIRIDVQLRPLMAGVHISLIDPSQGKVVGGLLVRIFADGDLVYEGTPKSGVISLRLMNVTYIKVEAYKDTLLVGAIEATLSRSSEDILLKVPIFLDVKYKDLYEKQLKDYKKLKGKYDSLLSKYEALLTSYESLNRTYFELESAHEALKANFTKLRSEYTELMSKYKETLVNSSHLEEQLAELRSMYEDIKAEMRELNSTYLALKANYTYLKERYVELEHEHAKTLQEYVSLKKRYESLRSSWPLTTSVVAVLGVIGGAALGYILGRRRGEYVVITP